MKMQFNNGELVFHKKRKIPKLLVVTTVAATHRAFLLPFARHFANIGWLVDGVASEISNNKECQDTYSEVFDFPFARSPLQLLPALKEINKFRELILKKKYDLVHVHTPVAAFFTRFIVKSLPAGARPKVVYTAHGLHFYKWSGLVSLLYLILEKLAGYWTDCLITINQEDTQAAKKLKLAPKIIYMPGIGIDLAQYTPTPEAVKDVIRKELGISKKNKCIIMVAEFNKNKRQKFLLDAVNVLKDKDIIVLFAGSGSNMDIVKKHVEMLGLEKQVRFLGHRNDIRELLALADVNVLPSMREGLPRSMMEAMAVGTPNVGSRIRGIIDLLEGGCGGLFDVRSVNQLAEQIKQVLYLPGIANKWRNNARRKVAKFELQEIIGLHEKLYSEILG